MEILARWLASRVRIRRLIQVFRLTFTIPFLRLTRLLDRPFGLVKRAMGCWVGLRLTVNICRGDEFKVVLVECLNLNVDDCGCDAGFS